MSTFAQAVQAQDAVTTNGMAALKSSLNACVDLFFKIGASRGKNVVGEFTAAYVENSDIALRIAQWARDARGGAGERQIYRDVLLHLEKTDPAAAQKLILNTPEIGRWDDLLILTDANLKQVAFSLIKTALENKNGLCAKWMPRKGKVAEELRAYLGFTPKRYRKTLVELTKVVETQMCAKDWDNIEFGHVPSVAAARYRNAFKRNATESYTAYAEALTKGEAKINAGAVYPYDVLKSALGSYNLAALSKTDRDVINAQWAALPNYVGDANILPMVDVSGSMSCPAGGYNSKSGLSCMDVAVSLGLYLADKNEGAFKDTFLTFSSNPQLLHLKGDVLQKMDQMKRSEWGMSTNLEAAFRRVLEVAVKGRVPQEQMPEYILILSDMQFNAASRGSDTAQQMIERQYADAGYKAPKIVYWNLNAHDNVPVEFDKKGTALISGFSPSIMKSVLKAEAFTPVDIMMEAVMIPRYELA